ncbi:DUF4412 domain-containing protein [bacterium]|nr:DUF4412 domain-containing protein [bacterium]
MKRTYQIMAVILIVFSHAVYAGVYMKQKRHTDAFQMMGQSQPAKDMIEEIWLTDNGFRSDNQEQSMIYDLKKNVMIMLDHQKKTYSEMQVGKEMFPGMPDQEDETEAAQFQNMMKTMMKMEVSVEPTSEKKTIHQWPCRKYIMTVNMAMGQFRMEIWATEALKVDADLYKKFSAGMLSAMPGMQQAVSQMQSEMEKIKGVQVMNISTNQVMGQTMKTTMELLEFKEGKAPADLMQLPAGYKKQNIHGM